MLTVAVRELHLAFPGQFVTDVRTSCPQLWENNPWITPLEEDGPDVEVIACEYPLINQSNHAPYHVVHGYTSFLAARLGLSIPVTLFKGDIHISSTEKSWYSQIRELTGEDLPFWVLAAGGKNDFTIKWWDTHRFQRVVNYFRGRVLFVQIGEKGHNHPRLNGVVDLRGQTDLRQLLRLVYHSQGALCPVTLLMHLAASVEVKADMPLNRPCVVVAGGREPTHWEAYPHHQYVHTCGALLCCDQGGCWKARTVPIGDGDEKDKPEHLCVDVVKKTHRPTGSKIDHTYHLPKCMDMISAEEVIRRIELYFTGGAVRYLTSDESRVAKKAIELSSVVRRDTERIKLS